ncbi:MAG: hypothetical protein AAFX07_11390 [Pseudomonadota bacterium]
MAESRERIWEHTAFCWKELLDRAFAGFGPTDQALERIIDRMERGS